jgi:hypothetical protein
MAATIAMHTRSNRLASPVAAMPPAVTRSSRPGSGVPVAFTSVPRNTTTYAWSTKNVHRESGKATKFETGNSRARSVWQRLC